MVEASPLSAGQAIKDSLDAYQSHLRTSNMLNEKRKAQFDRLSETSLRQD